MGVEGIRSFLPIDRKIPPGEVWALQVSLRLTGPFGFAQGRLTRRLSPHGLSYSGLPHVNLSRSLLLGEFQGYEFGGLFCCIR